MYSFRLNMDTNQVEILKDGFVVLEIDQRVYRTFAQEAWLVSKYPLSMPKVRNAIDYSFKTA
jgi:hypothetical protein